MFWSPEAVREQHRLRTAAEGAHVVAGEDVGLWHDLRL